VRHSVKWQRRKKKKRSVIRKGRGEGISIKACALNALAIRREKKKNLAIKKGKRKEIKGDFLSTRKGKGEGKEEGGGFVRKNRGERGGNEAPKKGTKKGQKFFFATIEGKTDGAAPTTKGKKGGGKLGDLLFKIFWC